MAQVSSGKNRDKKERSALTKGRSVGRVSSFARANVQHPWAEEAEGKREREEEKRGFTGSVLRRLRIHKELGE